MNKLSLTLYYLKRNIPIIIISIILSIYQMTLFNYHNEDTLEFSLFPLLMYLILGLSIGILSNSRLYNKKSSSFFHSLPIKEKDYCISEIISSLLTIISIIVLIIIQLLLFKIKFNIIDTSLTLFKVILIGFSMSYFSGKISSKIFIQILLSLFIIALPYLLLLIAYYIDTYYFDSNLNILGSISNLFENITLYISVLFILLSLIVSKYIKKEKVSENVYFPIIGIILTYIISIVGSLYASLFTYGNFNYLFILFTLLIVFIICTMICESKFNILSIRNIIRFIICVVITSILVSSSYFIGDHYIKALPQLSSIDKAIISIDDDNYHTNNKETIAYIYKLHQYTLNHRKDNLLSNYRITYSYNNKTISRYISIYEDYLSDKSYLNIVSHIKNSDAYINKLVLNNNYSSIEIISQIDESEYILTDINDFITTYNNDIKNKNNLRVFKDEAITYEIYCYKDNKKVDTYSIYESDTLTNKYIKALKG